MCGATALLQGYCMPLVLAVAVELVGAGRLWQQLSW